MEPESHTIKRAQGGDCAAQMLILRHYARALRFLVIRMGLKHDVEDHLQDLYAKILTVLPRFQLDGPAKIGTWIFTVAHNWLVSRQRRPRLSVVPLDATHEAFDHAPPADHVYASGEMRTALLAAIDHLPEEQRRIFVMAQVFEQPLESIATAEGIAVGTVKSRLHRARARLVQDLGAQLDIEEGDRHATAR